MDLIRLHDKIIYTKKRFAVQMETRTKPNREAHRILVIGLSWYNQSLRFDSGWGQNFFL